MHVSLEPKHVGVATLVGLAVWLVRNVVLEIVDEKPVEQFVQSILPLGLLCLVELLV